MMRAHLLLSLAVALLGSIGCAKPPPPRPVPQPEGEPALPPWHPEPPWDKGAQADRVFFEGKVVFDTAKHTIRPESERVLNELRAWLESNPDISRIRLEGHTDSRAADEYNQALSERRAIAIADWLVDHGIDHERLLATAFGETRPIATNAKPEGRQENRRTSFFPAEVAGYFFRGLEPSNGGLVLVVKSKAEREAEARKGEVPVFVEPPVKVELDIIKPVPPPEKKEEDLAGVPASSPAPPPPPLPAPAAPKAPAGAPGESGW